MKRIRFYKWSCGTWTIHHCANNETNTLTFDKARHYIDEIVIQLPNYLIKIEKMKQKYFVNVLGTLCNWQLTGGGNNSLALTSSQSRGAGSRALAQSCCSNFMLETNLPSISLSFPTCQGTLFGRSLFVACFWRPKSGACHFSITMNKWDKAVIKQSTLLVVLSVCKLIL